MNETRTIDNLFAFLWAFSFSLSVFFVNTAWAEIRTVPEKTSTYFSAFLLAFMIPLIITALIWVSGRFVENIYLLTTAWCGCLYSMVYLVYFLFLMVSVGIGVLQVQTMEFHMNVLVFGLLVFPFLIPCISLWFLIKKYSCEEKKSIKKDVAYILAFLYMGIIFTLQFYAYSFLWA
jgi:hypothetical protein